MRDCAGQFNQTWPSRCIAGREIISGSSHYQIGGWIRPVSGASEEGELYESETILGTTRQPKIFDFIEVPLQRYSNDRLQPENWLIDSSRRWKLVSNSYQQPGMDLLVETPASLWLQRNTTTDRVTPHFLRALQNRSSICLIHVASVELSFGWREYQGRYSRRRRARFGYNGVQYDLSLTDPVVMDQYRHNYPAKNDPPRIIQLVNPSGYYLCVSLAPEFNDYHYKVVATVIEAT